MAYRVAFKDEDETPNGERLGPVWTFQSDEENPIVALSRATEVKEHGWRTIAQAETLARKLGVEVEEV